jgi:8-oxo-dGTP pyrophosphatase MutT (NUDIX family)
LSGLEPMTGQFDPEAFEQLARMRLFQQPDRSATPAAGDFETDIHYAENPAGGARTRVKSPRPAAVLIAIVPRLEGATVRLTQRASGLRDHSDQIAFPGGKIDDADDGPLKAALREAHEEVGLLPTSVRPLGYLAPYVTRTGFRVIPVVASIPTDLRLRLNPYEVSEAFEVPLDFLMDPANHRIDSLERDGILRKFYAMIYEGRYIWGVTAGIIRLLYERLYD